MTVLTTIDATKVRVLDGAITSHMEAGEATAVGRWVYVAADEKVYQCDAESLIKTTSQIGMVVAGHKHNSAGTITANEIVTVCWFGRVFLGEDLLTTTSQYYLADTSGGVDGYMTDDAGDATNDRRVGKPETKDIFFVNPDNLATASA